MSSAAKASIRDQLEQSADEVAVEPSFKNGVDKVATDEVFVPTFGEWARDLRGKRTLAEFHEEFGIDKSTMSRWESGKVIPHHGSLRQLAKAAAIDVKVLYKMIDRSIAIKEADDAEITSSRDEYAVFHKASVAVCGVFGFNSAETAKAMQDNAPVFDRFRGCLEELFAALTGHKEK